MFGLGMPEIIIIAVILGVMYNAFKTKKRSFSGGNKISLEATESRLSEADSEIGIDVRGHGEVMSMDDKKYDKVINCPQCFGEGNTYIKIITEKYDNGQEIETEYLADKSYYDNYIKAIIDGKQAWFIRDNREDEYVTRECPCCKGDGLAYAWLESKPAFLKVCEQCQGKGQLMIKVKLEIGMGDKLIICDACKGNGKVNVSEKTFIHVMTISGGKEIEAFEGTSAGGEIGPYPKKYVIEITSANKDFYSKSKPRP